MNPNAAIIVLALMGGETITIGGEDWFWDKEFGLRTPAYNETKGMHTSMPVTIDFTDFIVKAENIDEAEMKVIMQQVGQMNSNVTFPL